MTFSSKEIILEYEQNFARSFMQRTLALAQNYSGPHDATLLINCLLGLLIVPKEALLDKVPATEFEKLGDWGIKPESIRAFGKYENGSDHRPNLRQLVHRLRNAVAHFRIDPIHHAGVVKGYSFRDQNGFHAQISLDEIKSLVTKLAQHLKESA